MGRKSKYAFSFPLKGDKMKILFFLKISTLNTHLKAAFLKGNMCKGYGKRTLFQILSASVVIEKKLEMASIHSYALYILGYNPHLQFEIAIFFYFNAFQ